MRPSGYNPFYEAYRLGPVSAVERQRRQRFRMRSRRTASGTIIDGISNPLDEAYIGDVETTFKDMAVFGELTWHLTSDWSVTGGTRLFKQTVSQAQQTGLLFDGLGFVSGNSQRRMEASAVEDQHVLSTR